MASDESNLFLNFLTDDVDSDLHFCSHVWLYRNHIWCQHDPCGPSPSGEAGSLITWSHHYQITIICHRTPSQQVSLLFLLNVVDQNSKRIFYLLKYNNIVFQQIKNSLTVLTHYVFDIKIIWKFKDWQIFLEISRYFLE